MNIKSFQAKTLADALRIVQSELGPEATLLETREVWDGWIRGLFGKRRVKVTATGSVANAGNLFARINQQSVLESVAQGFALDEHHPFPANPRMSLGSNSIGSQDFVAHDPQDFEETVPRIRNELDEMVSQLCGRPMANTEMPRSLFRVYTDLVEADVQEDVARELITKLRQNSTLGDLDDTEQMRVRLRELVTSMVRVAGPIRLTPGQRSVVALVGPTGVGKTTTIAKLAANFRLRDKRRVGLITVDTYRIAAIEQLRTYADIIDLPMEVVATPHEMREAIARLSDVDLILMDTAGRSPRDEVRLQELKMMLQEANPSEVHLVLSATSSAQGLLKTIQNFQDVGTTSLLLTKLDESTGLGNLLPVMQRCETPWSYLTNGQTVPDDIQTTDAKKLADWILRGSVQ